MFNSCEKRQKRVNKTKQQQMTVNMSYLWVLDNPNIVWKLQTLAGSRLFIMAGMLTVSPREKDISLTFSSGETANHFWRTGLRHSLVISLLYKHEGLAPPRKPFTLTVDRNLFALGKLIHLQTECVCRERESERLCESGSVTRTETGAHYALHRAQPPYMHALTYWLDTSNAWTRSVFSQSRWCVCAWACLCVFCYYCHCKSAAESKALFDWIHGEPEWSVVLNQCVRAIEEEFRTFPHCKLEFQKVQCKLYCSTNKCLVIKLSSGEWLRCTVIFS